MSRVHSKSTPEKHRAYQGKRRVRFDARRFLGFHSTLRRVRYCGRDAIKDQDVAIKVSGSGSERRAGVAGVQHCGSTWSCPVCSHKISAVRAAEIADAVAEWHRRGNRIIFLTLTMRHKKGQRLADLWKNGISEGWGRVTSGRAWKTDQETYGVLVPRTIKTGARAGETVTEHRIGFARVVETTQGINGWHVHVHALLFVRGDISGKEAMELGKSMFGRWKDALVAGGFGAPSFVNGVDVRLCGPADGNKVADYFTKGVFGSGNAGKLAWEAAGGTGKNGSKKFGNRTPFQILADLIESGPANADGVMNQDLALWWEWEEASKGKRQLTWSPWLRELLAPAQEEKSDEDIANEDAGGDTVLELRKAQWEAVEPRITDLLDAVEADEDMTAAYAWLSEHCRSANGDPLFAPGQFSRPYPLVEAA